MVGDLVTGLVMVDLSSFSVLLTPRLLTTLSSCLITSTYDSCCASLEAMSLTLMVPIAAVILSG